MRTLSRAFVAPMVAAVLALACVSFALATGHQTVPPATSGVYPCVPEHTGSHGGDYGNWQNWFQWMKNKYGTKWADALKAKYGSGLDKYIAAKYTSTPTTSTYFGGSYHHGGNDDDCEPECPGGKASSNTMSTSTYGGMHHGGDDEDDCEGENPGCGPDKNGGWAGGSGYHDGQPPKSDNRGDCPDVCKNDASYSNRTPYNQGGASGGSANHGKCDPPDADTGGCGSCRAKSFTINGIVDPNGNATQYKFEYGTTPAFGMETDWTSAGSGTTGKSVSETLDDLSPGTKVYYRLFAKSSRGTRNGSTRYCSTAAAQKPDAVTGGNDPKSTAATINGTVDPNGSATTAYFQWGKTNSLGSTAGSQSAGSGDSDKSVSTGLSGLTPGTKYYYRVVATNAKGTDYGEIKSFTTPAEKPKCSTGGYGSLSKSGAGVNGTVNPGGGSTSYYFEYGKTTSLGSKSGTGSAGSGMSDASASQNLSGLSSNTKYYYRVVAANAEGTTYGSVMSFTTAR
jgi:hypothetical protein